MSATVDLTEDQLELVLWALQIARATTDAVRANTPGVSRQLNERHAEFNALERELEDQLG